jgi:large subunit ribosomal protein L24
MSSIQPRKQRLARYTAPYHRRHREMSAPVDKGLRERQLARGFMYPRSMPVRKGDRVLIVRGEGKTKSASVVAKVDRKARKIYVEGFTYFKSDGTELQRPIDPSNLVIINPDWSDIYRRKLLTRVNESVEWTDSVISDFEAAEDEYEEETVGPIVKETTDESADETEETVSPIEKETTDESADEAKETTEENSSDNDVNYDDMKVPDLKNALKEKGLPVSGKKSELIDRLKGESK